MNNRSIRPLTTCALLLLLCQLAFATDRYVSIEGGHVPPFTSWADAATNIQDAIDASVAGDTVWVTNGVDNTGGKSMGVNTNRVALDKALSVRSVNGPYETFIQGSWDRGGTNPVRCAWLASGSKLVGFTIEKGATTEFGGEASIALAEEQGSSIAGFARISR